MNREQLPVKNQYWADRLGIAVKPKEDAKFVDFGDNGNPIVAQYWRDKNGAN